MISPARIIVFWSPHTVIPEILSFYTHNYGFVMDFIQIKNGVSFHRGQIEKTLEG